MTPVLFEAGSSLRARAAFDAHRAPAGGRAQAKPRVLYVTQSKGFKHAVLPESEKDNGGARR